MTATTYTLTGFEPFLALRSVSFLEPLPAIRVCSVCGIVSSITALLPCCHVVCKEPCGRQVEADKCCPLDGRLVTASSTVQYKFEQSELEQLPLHCLNGPGNCSFTGKLSELKEHVSECLSEDIDCAKCRRRVRRHAAASHCRTWGGPATSTTGDAGETDACGDLVKEVARMKEDLQKLRGQLPEEDKVNANVVNDVNSLAERAMHLEAQLVSLVKENADLKGPILAGSPAAVVATGPCRTATVRGSAITLYKLGNIFTNTSVKGEPCTLKGYTFTVWCNIYGTVPFQLVLCSGPWDCFVDWPFAKSIKLIIPHLRDESKDISISALQKTPSSRSVRKPRPGESNDPIPFEKVNFEDVKNDNFTLVGDLYVNVEFM